MRPSFSCGLAAAILVLSLSACSNHPLRWEPVDLPGSGGADLRDAADCGDRWWVVGGLRAADGSTRPAAWTGTDAGWQPVTFAPLPTSYYGPQQVITSVACADGRVAMVGAVPGGAHGNPRVSTWRLDGDRMVENAAPFETYGGDTAVDVGPIAAGPAGFAIAGNRTSGAAAWLSPDGRTFTLHENDPGLAGDTVARDAITLPDGRWAVFGSADGQAAAWVGGAGWAREYPPTEEGVTEIQRVVRQGDEVVAAGIHDTEFQLWHRRGGTWTAGETFGGDPAGVRSLTIAGGRPVLVGGGLWIDGKSADAPATPVAVAGRGDALLLVAADRIWQTTL
ncbi:hypothetical protein [Paractinoplanes toevensis]|uniref:hypothetical protein n=1 Tax=Paractinoplanes toevensis TaxID=571911 RepID=UPI001BB2FE39|nr:hypothetical protein [Actinoplanes toevensis]